MSRYLLASDFDGTLVHWPANEVCDFDRKAIRRFREAGNIFVIITGRRYEAAIAGLNQVGFNDCDAVLCLSGAYCVTPDGKEVYDKRTIFEGNELFLNYFKDTNPNYLLVDIGNEWYSIDIGNTIGDNVLSFEEATKLGEFTSFNASYKSVEETYNHCKKINALYGNMITALQNGSNIDMPPAGINKASAAKIIADMYQINDDNIFTVGDNYNDKDMIESYHGNAMTYAPDEVREKAEHTVSLVGEVINNIMGDK